MKVLHAQKVKGMGGSERHLLTLLPALHRRGVEVRMAVAATEASALFVGPLRKLGVDTVVLPAGPDVNPGLVVALHREIRRFRPDVVHTHLVHADLHGQVAARATGVPSVSSFHNAHSFYRQQPLRSVAQVVGRIPRRTIAISRYVAEFLRDLRLSRPDRIRVVYYGIEPADWEFAESDRVRSRLAFEVGSDEVVVGIAARLIPGKGHVRLFDVFRELSSRGARLRLLVAGDGPLRSDLEKRSRDFPDPRVRFLGHLQDVRPLMAASDMVVFPTEPVLGEGFGMAALEAMASGRPVVATAVGALPEVVADGETGLLVAAGSSQELRDALARLVSDRTLRQQMGDKGRLRARDEFSVDRMVDRHLAIYQEIA